MDIEQRKQQLLTLRRELEKLSNLASDARKAVKLDQSAVGRLSRMDAMQGQAMAKATEARRAKDLYRIENALRLIDAGDYGFCDQCGEAIAEKRLDIDPLAVRCINCAQ